MRSGSSLSDDFWFCLHFYTRLPVPGGMAKRLDTSLAPFARAIRMLPFAGAVIGGLAAAVLVAAAVLGLPPAIAGPLTIAFLVVCTGALHEDGLADCADGFFGGGTPQHRLAIMGDSRIGAFGAAALSMSLYLRAASLSVVAGNSVTLAAAVLIGAAALSRMASLMPLLMLPPAKGNGAGFCAGKPEKSAFVFAACMAVAISLVPALAGSGILRALSALAAAAGAAYALVPLARSVIGGQTGDVAGAAQQVSEIAYLIVFTAYQGSGPRGA